MSLRPLLVILCVAFSLSSCFKDGVPLPAQCKVASAVYYANGLPSDSTFYTYSGNKITGLKTQRSNYQFAYDSIYVAKRSLFTTDPLHADRYDSILYNPNRSIHQINTYINLGSAYLLGRRMEFAYNGSKMSSITVFDLMSGQEVKTDRFDYVYSGSNIVSVTYTDFSGATPVSEVLTYSHDTDANFFRKQNSQAFFIDPFFEDLDGRLLPFAFDGNNVTNISISGTSVSVTLDLDEYSKNLQDIKLNGILAVQYHYNCQ